MINAASNYMTLDEFLALPETLTPTELFDGELIVSPAPAFKHQEIAARVFSCIDNFKPDGKVLFAPLDVVLGPGTVVQPDVLWISDANDSWAERDGKLYGPPDLCVEILLPSTARKDRTKKFNAYEAASVREYWIVEPTIESIEVWVLTEGEYDLVGTYRTPQTFASPVLNASAVPLVDIFPLPAST